MDDVLRALKQKKQLTKRYQTRDDRETWDGLLQEIIDAADQRLWSHAGMLLERMTSALDKEGHANDEAKELYDFVIEQWKVLRNQCEAANIKVVDEDRRACEEAIAEAESALQGGRVKSTLDALGQADAAMERLRNDPRVAVRLGNSLSGYGSDSKNRSARQRIPHRSYTSQEDGHAGLKGHRSTSVRG